MKLKSVRMKRACDVPVSAMTKVEGGHHCPQCDKMVWDLRGASRAEAEALFRRSEATPCVRILPDAGGLAILRRSRNAAAVGAALFAATAAAGCEDAVEKGLDHAAHLGIPHVDQHTEEYGLAGEPLPEWDVEEGPPGTETVPADHLDEPSSVEGPRPDTPREGSPPTASSGASESETETGAETGPETETASGPTP